MMKIQARLTVGMAWGRLTLLSTFGLMGVANSTSAQPLDVQQPIEYSPTLTPAQTHSEPAKSAIAPAQVLLNSTSMARQAKSIVSIAPLLPAEPPPDPLPSQVPPVPDFPRPTPQPQPLPEAPQLPPVESPLQEIPPAETSPSNEQRDLSDRDRPVCSITQPDSPLIPPTDPATLTVGEFRVVGSTIYDCEELKSLLLPYLNRPISFAELLQARSTITDRYIADGYITTGAYIPLEQPQSPLQENNAVVEIQVVEGSVEEIRVSGTERLDQSYVRSRLRLGASTPLNEQRLINALRLLQINPLIDNISAELRAGIQPGTNILDVQVAEANPFEAQLTSNNGRSPSVGRFRRGIGLTHGNLFGFGDALGVNYNNTDGSNSLDLSYTLPINPQNGTLSFNYGTTANRVIDPPIFEDLDIELDSRYYQLTLRQPIFQTPTQELALSVSASRSETESSVQGRPTALSEGADEQGRTRVSAIRFSQEWVQQSSRHVLAARSQFSFGIDALDATISDVAPDSRFFAWRGQLQWVRLFGVSQGNPPIAPTLLIRTDAQFADSSLVSIEQFGSGGLGSIRGYRQDTLLTDNGVLASAEFRLPIARISNWQTVVLLVPFIDVGAGWNNDNTEEIPQNTLAAIGLGLQINQSRRFSLRLDWGIPLISIDESSTWRNNGIYFSLEFNPFR